MSAHLPDRLCAPASPQEREEASCSGKHRFTDPALARRVASRTSHTHSEPMSAYRCRLCGGWHIGSHLHKARRRKRS